MEKLPTKSSGSSVPQKNGESPIVFKPITDGLGFHPFSDGLPYAPIGKSPATLPEGFATAGATAAGPARSVYSIKNPSLPAAKTLTTPAASRVSVPVVTRESEPKSVTPAVKPTPAPVQSSPYKNGYKNERKLGYSYLAKRFCAFLIDSIANTLLCGAVVLGLMWIQDLNYDTFLSPNVVFLGALALFLLNWFLISIQEFFFHTSFGKSFFRLVLIGSSAKIFLRSLLFFPSLAFLGFGIIWSLLDSKKRCWHDRFVGIQPIERGWL